MDKLCLCDIHIQPYAMMGLQEIQYHTVPKHGWMNYTTFLHLGIIGDIVSIHQHFDAKMSQMTG